MRALDDDGQPLWYDIEFFGWSERGHWFRTGAIYREAPDGRLRWTTPRWQVLLAEQQRGRRAIPIAARGLFIGRDAELAQLERAPPRVGRGRSCRRLGAAAIGAVQGMPGVGKSYLATRLLRSTATTSRAASCASPLRPMIPARGGHRTRPVRPTEAAGCRARIVLGAAGRPSPRQRDAADRGECGRRAAGAGGCRAGGRAARLHTDRYRTVSEAGPDGRGRLDCR